MSRMCLGCLGGGFGRCCSVGGALPLVDLSGGCGGGSGNGVMSGILCRAGGGLHLGWFGGVVCAFAVVVSRGLHL